MYQLSNKLYYKIVSNPWREAIEENISDHKISYELLYSLTKEVYHKSVLVSSFHLSHRNIFLLVIFFHNNNMSF